MDIYCKLTQQEIKTYKLPELRQIQKLMKLDYKNLRNEYREMVRCSDQLGRSYLSTRYYIYSCSKFKSQVQKQVLMVINNKYRELQEFLEGISRQKAKQIVKKKYNKFSLLYHSARAGHKQPIQILVKHGSIITFGNQISTPMHAAAFYGHIHIVQLLLDLGYPIHLRNKYDNLAINQSSNQQIKQLLQKAYKCQITKLNYQLIQLKYGIGKFKIYYQKQLVGHKIVLRNYINKTYNRINCFHGTNYQALKSIVSNGLKMIGDTVQGKVIQTVKGHELNFPNLFGVENYAEGIFTSKQILYAGHPIYAKSFKIKDGDEQQSWNTVVQIKLKMGYFNQFQSTIGSDLPAGLPWKVEERVGYVDLQKFERRIIRKDIVTQSKEVAEVVAIIFVKSGFLQRFQHIDKGNQLMNDLFLNSPQQRKFFLSEIK